MSKFEYNKITDSHSTLTGTAREIIEIVAKYEEVSKIGIGYITHVPGGRKDIKFLKINGGIKAMVRGSGAVQELYIYTSEPEFTKSKISEYFK